MADGRRPTAGVRRPGAAAGARRGYMPQSETVSRRRVTQR